MHERPQFWLHKRCPWNGHNIKLWWSFSFFPSTTTDKAKKQNWIERTHHACRSVTRVFAFQTPERLVERKATLQSCRDTVEHNPSAQHLSSSCNCGACGLPDKSLAKWNLSEAAVESKQNTKCQCYGAIADVSALSHTTTQNNKGWKKSRGESRQATIDAIWGDNNGSPWISMNEWMRQFGSCRWQRPCWKWGWDGRVRGVPSPCWA